MKKKFRKVLVFTGALFTTLALIGTYCLVIYYWANQVLEGNGDPIAILLFGLFIGFAIGVVAPIAGFVNFCKQVFI